MKTDRKSSLNKQMRIYNKMGVRVIELKGSIQQEETDSLESMIHDLYTSGQKYLVIDLKNVQNLCSSALGILVTYKKIFQEENGDIKLVMDSPTLKHLFHVTMLDNVFEMSESAGEAIANFQR